MDVSFYISELLELHGEVSVPGLGHLTQTRVSGYYNAADFKFYPPHNEVKFDHTRLNEDHVLTQYIADKKHISLESSQYFTEKYVTNLKEDASYHDVAIASIGWFYNDGGKLAFKANTTNTDPVFYGYPAVRANKLLSQGTPPPAAIPAPAIAETEPQQVDEPAITFVPEKTDTVEEQEETEEVYDEEPGTNTALRTVLYILLAIIILLGITYAAYRYNPAAFERVLSYMKPKNAKSKSEPAATLKIDTNASAADTTVHIDSAVIADTVIKKNTPAGTVTDKISQTEVSKTTVVTTPVGKPVTMTGPKPNGATTIAPPKVTNAPKVRYFEIIIYSAKTTAEANRVMRNYNAIGVPAHIAVGATGKGIKISGGTFKSLDEAEVNMTQLIETGKIKKDSYPEVIKR